MLVRSASDELSEAHTRRRSLRELGDALVNTLSYLADILLVPLLSRDQDGEVERPHWLRRGQGRSQLLPSL